MTLVDAHIEAERRLRVLMEQGVGQAWTSLAHYNRADVAPFLEQVVPLITAGQRQSVALTNAYLARAMERQPVGVDTAAIVANLRGGADPREVYERPFVNVWTDLANGIAWNDAVKTGLERAMSAAAMDMQLAMRDTAHAVGLADDAIHGWERVPNPGACDFCLIAATQTYSTGDLQPLHNRCGCSVAPLTESTDPLSGDRISGTGDFQGIEVAIRDHGELGPVLTDASDHFAHVH